MRTIKIYIEGKSDLLFVSQFLKSLLGLEFKVDIKTWKANYTVENKLKVSLQTMTPKDGEGGINSDKIYDLIQEIKLVNSSKGVESIILLDADTAEHKHPQGGFNARRDYLADFSKDADFKYFIIPDHNNDGNLESILDRIVCARGTEFYKCLNQYVSGLLNLKGEERPQYIIDNPKLDKEKINWYVYMMEGKKGSSKNPLDNSSLWDFNSTALDPLKDFFRRIFS